MASPVVIDFLIRGMPAAQQALRTVEQTAAAADRARAREAQRASALRTRAEQQEARDKIRAMQRADAEVRRIQSQATRSVERQAQQKARAEEKAERETVRAAEKAANERLAVARRVDREFAQMQARRARENERLLREGQRLEERTHRESVRLEARTNRELARRQEQEDKQRSGFRERFARGIGNVITATGSKVVGAMTQTAGMVGQLGGGFSIADSVQRASKNAGQLEDILNSAYNPASKIQANKRRLDASEVQPEIAATSIRYGMERSDVQEGLGDITGITGDLETARKLMPQLAELSRATGSSFADMANAAGNVGLAFDDMTDSGKKAEQIMSVMRTLAGQGKAGNVEIRDQAVQAAKIVASSGKFAGDNAENIVKLGALMQFSRGGGGSWNAASAATAVNAFTSTFGKGARLGAFEGLGIDVFADKEQTKIRPPEQIIADSLDKTKGNVPQMTALFGSVMSMRAVNKFSEVYTRAETEKKGSGRQKVLDEFASMTKGVAMTKGEVTDAARRRTGALDAQMASSREKFDDAVQRQLIPALIKLAPIIEQMIPIFVDLHAQALPAFVDLIKTVADFATQNKELIHDIAAHPIGTILAAEVTKSVAGAGIGQVIARLLGGGGGGGGGGVPTNPGVLAVAAGAAGVAVGANAMIKYASGDEKAKDYVAKLEAYKRGDTERGISPEAAQKELDQANARLNKSSTLEHVGDLMTSPFVDASSRDYAKYKNDQGFTDNKDLRELLEEMKKNSQALRANTEATSKNSTTGGGATPIGPPKPPEAANTGIVQRKQ